MERKFSYTATSKLACVGCGPSDVIICVADNLVVQPAGVNPTTPYNFIYGQLIDANTFNNSYNQVYWQYVFVYDDTQLVPGAQVLGCDSVKGIVCQGCLTDWVKALVGNGFTVIEGDAGYLDLTNSAGDLFSVSTGWTELSQAMNGVITVSYPDGTTQTLNGALSGAILDPAGTNILHGGGSGILLTCQDVAACVPAIPLVANDSNTIDFSTSGNGNHTITGVVKVSPDSGNQVQSLVNGLFVAAGGGAGTETALTVTDSSTVDLTANGPSNHTLTAAVKISATAGNQIAAQADGIYAGALTETANTVTDTSSIDFINSGVAGRNISGVVRISATGGNALSINGDGLFATGAGINTIDIGSGSQSVGASYAVRVASLTGSTLSIKGAPEHYSVAGEGYLYNILGTATDASYTIGQYSIPASALTINNPSLYRALNILSSFTTQGSVEMPPNYAARQFILESLNGAAFANPYPNNLGIQFRTKAAETVNKYQESSFTWNRTRSLAAAGSLTLQWQTQMSQNSLIAGGNIEYLRSYYTYMGVTA